MSGSSVSLSLMESEAGLLLSQLWLVGVWQLLLAVVCLSLVSAPQEVEGRNSR